MSIEFKQISTWWIGYVKVHNINVYAFLSDSLEENIEGIKVWLAAKTPSTTFSLN